MRRDTHRRGFGFALYKNIGSTFSVVVWFCAAHIHNSKVPPMVYLFSEHIKIMTIQTFAPITADTKENTK